MKSEQMVEIDRTSLEAMIDSLDHAINICFEVDSQSDNLDKS